MDLLPWYVLYLIVLHVCSQLEELVFFGNPIHRNMVDKDPEGELAWPRYVLTVLAAYHRDGLHAQEAPCCIPVVQHALA